MQGAASALVLTAFLLPGAVAAAEGAGHVATVPAYAPMDGDPLALLLYGADGKLSFDAFEVRADVLRVEAWDGGYHYVGDVFVQTFPNRATTHELRDAVVTLKAGGTEGYVGIHPDDEDRVGLVAPAPVDVATSERSVLGTYESTGSTTRPEKMNPTEVPYYYHAVEGPHLVIRAAGDFTFRGHGRIQLQGPDLVVSSREGQRTFETGVEPPSALGAGEMKQRWVVLEGENLTFRARADVAWTMALSELATEGALITPDGVVLAPAAAAPMPSPEPSPVERLASPAGVGLGLALGAVVVGGAGVFAVRRRRGHAVVHDPTESWDPEECLRRAGVHVEARHEARALEWILRARQLAPTSARAAATHAFILERLDRLEESFAAYEDAVAFGPDEGEHEMDAARLAARLGRPASDVEARVVRALAKTPPLVQRVEEDPAFRPLAGRPAFEMAAARAWARYTVQLSGEDARE